MLYAAVQVLTTFCVNIVIVALAVLLLGGALAMAYRDLRVDPPPPSGWGDR